MHSMSSLMRVFPGCGIFTRTVLCWYNGTHLWIDSLRDRHLRLPAIFLYRQVVLLSEILLSEILYFTILKDMTGTNCTKYENMYD